MHFSLVLPALEAGAKARRRAWGGRQYIYVDGPYSDGKSIHRCSGASYGSWPTDAAESRDLLADDWELLPKNLAEYHSVIRSELAHAVDVVTAALGEVGYREKANWRKSVEEAYRAATEVVLIPLGPQPIATYYKALRHAAVSSAIALADFMAEHASSIEEIEE